MSPLSPPPAAASALHGPAPGVPAADATRAGIASAAEQFEAVIIRQMLAAMRQARLSEDFLGSQATDNFRELADARLADAIAAQRRFGVASLVEAQLGKSQGEQR